MWRVRTAPASVDGPQPDFSEIYFCIDFRMITIVRLRYAVAIAERDHSGALFVQCQFIRTGAG